MSSLDLENEFNKFVSQFENYQDFENLVNIMDKFVAGFKLSPDLANFHKAVISNDLSRTSSEPDNPINFFHSIKLKYKTNSSEDGMKSVSEMSNFDHDDEKDFKSEEMDLTETKPKNERFNMKKAVHYLTKDNKIIEEIKDDFKNDDDFVDYAKNSLVRYFPDQKFSFIKRYNSMINKKYYFECQKRKNRCRVKAIFIRQDGISIFLICNSKHNHS
ncbi:hypothetical protein BpHYR1_025081 [Brachionus plicatilis]|uniref:Uncharacterized protein n=1 Tax=Brachionus plicatilis TaxID=10195 RepID=A0A3M7RH93_BRAPC|nr:hypothetical protein BpHYR1_025081 [Brachionus plicatilis]